MTPTAGMISGRTRPVVPERGLAEHQRGDQGHGVGLEQVSGHPGAVADVVTDVVGDGRGVARVVLGDALLDLADQVGADVGGLGEDAAADAHEHGEQRGAKAEALEHLRGVLVEDQRDDARAEQAEPDGEHADDAAGAEGDRVATLAPLACAAAAVRTLARVASVIPAKPTNAENTAPTRKNTERPIRVPVLSAGRMNSSAEDHHGERRERA